VRLTVRRKVANAQVENRDYGLFCRSGASPDNLQSAHSVFRICSHPKIRNYGFARLDTLVMDVPDQPGRKLR